ncbi:MAG: hypothetical protein EP330_26120 [Deltaproteobacteria bacterium]|nr:MAG: hypothetical protein EP330_26120 [Deltaproteobacteria bacterium]
MLTVYAGRELGDYGYEEKPWYQPGARLEAFLGQLEGRGLAVSWAEAPPATDEELATFHDRDYVAEVTRRCAENRGSLDRAPDIVCARSRELLRGIAEVRGEWVPEIALEPVLDALDATLAAFAPFLESEGLVEYDAIANAVRLTDAGAAFLADPAATLGGPTFARAHVERAARHVCGAVIDATRRLARGDVKTAFVPIAGFHHAHRQEARMYCLYNDPGLALEMALRAVEGTVAYIDVDIHHGDGVYEAFAAHPRVVIADLHEGPRVPAGEVRETGHIGEGAAVGTKRALAVGHGMDDARYLAAWERLEAFVREAKPSFIVFEAGVDGLAGDPMSRQDLTPAVFGEIARRVKALAEEHAEGRLLVLGGGGYELTGMAEGWAAVVEALMG